jgi:alkaline phosphatase D
MNAFSWKRIGLMACLWTALSVPALAEAELIAGPLVGHTDPRSSRIWLQTDEAGEARIEYWRVGDTAVQRSESLQLREQTHFAGLIPLSGLVPGQNYQYRVLLDGQPLPAEHAQMFRTPTEWVPGRQAPDFEILIGSCYYINDDWMTLLGIRYGGPLNIFTTMLAHPADLMLWLGDNVYLSPMDTSSAWRMNARYHKHRTHPLLQPLLARMPQYAIWDDHDFGPNNSTRHFYLRESSLELFKNYWANPRYGLLTAPGTWSSFSWNDADFFLTDGRYYRDGLHVPATERRMLGAEQMAWLKQALLGSRAPFKLVAVGSQVFNPFISESFRQFPLEYNELLTFIRERKIEGVIFLSGDRHHTDLHKIQPSGSYPLYDYTNSPLSSAPTRIMSPAEVKDPNRVEGSLFRERNYGRLHFSGPPGQRVLTLETRSASGQLLWTYRIPQSELMFPR